MLSFLLRVPSCIYSFCHGVISTSYFIFNDFYTCIRITYGHTLVVIQSEKVVIIPEKINVPAIDIAFPLEMSTLLSLH